MRCAEEIVKVVEQVWREALTRSGGWMKSWKWVQNQERIEAGVKCLTVEEDVGRAAVIRPLRPRKKT